MIKLYAKNETDYHVFMKILGILRHIEKALRRYESQDADTLKMFRVR